MMSDLKQSRLCRAIGLIFDYDEHWLNFFFSHKRAELRESPAEMIKEACCYSHGEQIKIRVALDLWTMQNHVSIAEIVETLDFDNLCRVVLAIIMIREISVCNLEELQSQYEV